MKILKSKKLIAILLISVAIIAEFISTIVYCNHYKSANFSETLYYSSQIISSIFLISGVVIAVWQYYLSSKSIKTDLEIQQVQRAIDLSEYYKNNILNYYPALKYIFDETGISKIVGNLRIDQLNDFDIQELKTLFSSEQIKKLKEIQNSEEFAKTVINANVIYGLKSSIDIKLNSENAMLTAYISNIVNELLNNMEFFALHFSHKTADESVIYQSLHQTFLEIVQYNYYEIAERNIDSTSKYYTNVIWLFNIWRNRKLQQNNIRSQKSQLVQSAGTIINQ